jgi:hypothetical protein
MSIDDASECNVSWDGGDPPTRPETRTRRRHPGAPRNMLRNVGATFACVSPSAMVEPPGDTIPPQQRPQGSLPPILRPTPAERRWRVTAIYAVSRCAHQYLPRAVVWFGKRASRLYRSVAGLLSGGGDERALRAASVTPARIRLYTSIATYRPAKPQ